MIFISCGSREYPFNRLLEKVDELVEEGSIQEEVFAQIGQSTYSPKHYSYEHYLSSEEFSGWQSKADLIISHAGTGALISALKKEKQVIAVPRLAKFGEHIDDHQLQVATALSDMGFLLSIEEMEKLGKVITCLKKHPITQKYDKESRVIDLVDQFITLHSKK